LKLVQKLPENQREPLAPDDLVWADADNRSNARFVLTGSPAVTASFAGLFPESQYALVSLVAAPPYGVTRVYTRRDRLPDMDHPAVSVYDAPTRQWSVGVGSTLHVTVTPAPALRLTSASAPRAAEQTVAGDLPAGTYVIRVRLAPAAPGTESAVVMATAADTAPDPFQQPAPDFDVSPIFAGENAAYLVYRHRGGRVFVSQFGGPAGLIDGVDAMAVLSVTDYERVRQGALPVTPIPATSWTAASAGLHLAADGEPNSLSLTGTTMLFGYEAFGPHIRAQAGDRVALRVDITVDSGRSCLGVLDEDAGRWIVAPATLEPSYEFEAPGAHTMRPVLANCSPAAADVAPVHATIGPGSYSIWSPPKALYVDELMRARREAGGR
jgi:hypothetical protein